MYKCELCDTVSRSKQGRLTYHAIRMHGPLAGSIERELAVCHKCHRLLTEAGWSVDRVRSARHAELSPTPPPSDTSTVVVPAAVPRVAAFAPVAGARDAAEKILERWRRGTPKNGN